MKKILKNLINLFWRRNIHIFSIVKRDCSIANSSRVGPFCVIDGEGGKVIIGERCSVNASSWIGAGMSSVRIGNDVRMGAGVKISCSHHNFERMDKGHHRMNVRILNQAYCPKQIFQSLGYSQQLLH